jgi:energy-converting hydrogenase B subunit K
MAWEWDLIRKACTGCGICRDVCPHGAIEMTRAMAYPGPVPGACIGCLDCVAECPFEALVVRESCLDRST